MKKIAVTYMQHSVVYKKILFFNGLYGLHNDIANYGINENEILKIEFILEAEDYNIIDETQ